MENNFKNIAITSMVLGIVSVVLSFLGWGAIAGLICGILSIFFYIKYKKATPEKNSFATTGLITGIVGASLSVILFIVFIISLTFLNKVTNIANDTFGSIKDQIEEQINDGFDYIDSLDTEESEDELEEKIESKVSEIKAKISDLKSKLQEVITSGDNEKIEAIQSEISELQKELINY